ncbi:MAG: hypothetical protein DRJ38_01915 [Thermoprotei archaeon]|nr:MAG: hypothetical protein DRJ38_01915 [Thermoprotei archaeon]
MSETKTALTESGMKIPSGIQSLIMFFEERIINGRIKPLETKLTLLERKLDSFTTEIIKEAINSAITSAYKTISDEMRQMVRSEVERGVKEALTTYSADIEKANQKLEEYVNAVKSSISSLSGTLEAKLSEVQENLTKLEPRLEIDAERIGKEISEKLTPVADQLAKHVLEKVTPYVRRMEELESRLLGISRQVEQLGRQLAHLTSGLDEYIASLERAGILKPPREEEKSDMGQPLSSEELEAGGGT